MPQHTASCVFTVFQKNSVHALFDGEILLVAADLFDVIVVDNKVANEIQQAFRMQERDECSVLLLDLSVRRAFSAPIVQPFFVIFMPGHKLLGGSPAGTVEYLVRVHCQDKLGIPEQLGNIVFSPVADILGDAFHHINAGALALDDNERDPVYKHDNIRTGEFPVRTFNLKLIGNLQDIVLRMLEVNVVDIKRLQRAAGDGFLQSLAGAEEIIDLLIGSIKPCCTVLVQCGNRLGHRASGKMPELIADRIVLLP